MTLITDIMQQATCKLRPNVATIGFFDGVHRGHRYLIEQVKEEAKSRSLASLLISFAQHPSEVMQSTASPGLLSTLDEKCEKLADTQVDYCVLLPFTKELANYSARRFMQEVLYEQLQVRVLIVGYDHRFGHNRSEGFLDYVNYGKELGIEVIQAKAYTDEGIGISSSCIRQLLQEGEVKQAARGLGYNYSLNGIVTGGYQVGRTLGYPTANITVADKRKLLPADGVYAAYAFVKGERYQAMLNIGYRPTFNTGREHTIDVHLLEFNEDLYDQPLQIEFVTRLRGERQFADRDKLTEQLKKDEEEARKWLSA